MEAKEHDHPVAGVRGVAAPIAAGVPVTVTVTEPAGAEATATRGAVGVGAAVGAGVVVELIAGRTAYTATAVHHGGTRQSHARRLQQLKTWHRASHLG